MEDYFKLMPLDCEQQIRDFAIADIEAQLGATAYTLTGQVRVRHTLPNELLEIVNTELMTKYNIPPVEYCQSYLRPKKDIQRSHIDGDGDNLRYAAINIPLKGTTGSIYRWLNGTYETQLKYVNDLVFHNLLWMDIPSVGATLELDQPYIINVGHPHRSEASKTEDKWVFTMRFYGNPTFDSLRDGY
jgi:hypothetical protein